MQRFEDYTPVPFETRWEKLVGDVSVREVVERLNGVKLGDYGRLINGLLFYHSGSQDDWDRYGEFIYCKKPVEGVPLNNAGGTGHEYRWTIGLQYYLYQSPKDRTVPWGYDQKDHNARGDAVFSSKQGTAAVGLTHAFKILRVSDEEAAADLRLLMAAPPLPELTPQERAALAAKLVF
jgi:hypothetical protein